ncbi:MAG TPA: sulfate ABC transporter permease subunit CysW [Candidatus Tumulicola sp.]|nr:sulfate ABC transporter permease subunit CysW [Candidatus Tumulicola sp.]
MVNAIPSVAISEPAPIRYGLIGVAVVFAGIFLVLPLAAVFAVAFGSGIGAYLRAFSDPDTLASIRLTIVAAAIAVPSNVAFGLCAAWLLGKFDFFGRSVLISLVDLPFSVSPVVAGLSYVLVYGLQGAFGPWLAAHGVRVIFAIPGIVLVTTFVTFPFVVREVLPTMEAHGNEEEEAALTLGASGWNTFARVTLPNVKWALLYGVILCNARAMGEFGAVSVVSGHIRGLTDTMPLQIEILYNDYQFVPAFAVATLLAALALTTLAAKSVVEWRSRR